MKCDDYIKYSENINILINGGRTNGQKILKKLNERKEYGNKRNNLNYSTTHLSFILNLDVYQLERFIGE